MWGGRLFIGLTVLLGLVIGGFAASWVVLWLSVRTSAVRVPPLEGLPVARAVATLQSVGLIARTQAPVAHSHHPAGVVARQRPAAGFQLKRGSTVFLYPSSGVAGVVLPDLRGLPLVAAVAQLEQLGLAEGTVVEVFGEADGSTVVAQAPPPGGSVAVGGAVSLLLNRGAEQTRVVMPDLVGETLSTAKDLLARWGFRLDGVQYVSYPGLPLETVLKQAPTAGGPAEMGGGVLLWVAR